MANSYLNKTFGSAGNRKTFTMSCWIKRSSLSSHQRFFGWKDGGGGYGLIFEGSDRYDALRSYIVSGSSNAGFLTNRLFRDVSAWYNIVLKIDTTQSTEADRMRLYINGVEETSFASRTYPNQNEDTSINKADICRIGVNPGADNSYFDGYMSHVAFVDGQALAPTVFGETDSTSGIWKFKAPSGVTWGSNGFHLKFENSANLGLDSSGNSNTFTVNGNGRQALDTPSNVSATGNSLSPYANRTISNGNLTTTSTTTNWTSVFSTIGVSTGKWYIELKATAGSYHSFGIVNDFPTSENASIGDFTSIATQQIGYYSYYGTKKVNETTSSYGASWTNGDIISMALDLDNNKLYFAKNGTWQNSGVPTSGSTGTGAISVNSGYTYFIGTSVYNSSATTFNFGNGYFGTTAISSAGSNGNGSLFEYDVPSGYYALNTKNINTYG